jgi:hypothetical protein
VRRPAISLFGVTVLGRFFLLGAFAEVAIQPAKRPRRSTAVLGAFLGVCNIALARRDILVLVQTARVAAGRERIVRRTTIKLFCAAAVFRLSIVAIQATLGSRNTLRALIGALLSLLHITLAGLDAFEPIQTPFVGLLGYGVMRRTTFKLLGFAINGFGKVAL